jgi:hypothetical protein
MVSPWPACGAGTRTGLGSLALCALVVACTASNPNFGEQIKTDGSADTDGPMASGGRPGMGGQSGGAGGGTGGVYGTGGTGGVYGTGGLGGGLDMAAQDTVIPSPDMTAGSDATIGMPSAVCGPRSVDPSVITGARGIAVDNDGFIYFTREMGTQAWIGRLAPGGALNASWVSLPTSSQPRTLRVSNARRLVFVALSASGTVNAYSTVDGGRANSTGALAGAHGLTIADDGGIFVSIAGGYVMRVIIDLQSDRVQTTSTPIFPAAQRPLGLAFGPDGHLFVGSSGGGIKRFRVQNKMLVEGTDYSQFNGSANDLAFDVEGRLYVADSVASTPRALGLVPPSGIGAVIPTGTVGLLAGLAFGRGMLGCQDIYVTDVSGAARRYPTTAQGLKMP